MQPIRRVPAEWACKNTGDALAIRVFIHVLYFLDLKAQEMGCASIRPRACQRLYPLRLTPVLTKMSYSYLVTPSNYVNTVEERAVVKEYSSEIRPLQSPAGGSTCHFPFWCLS